MPREGLSHQGRPREVLEELLAAPEFAAGHYFGVCGHLGHLSEVASILRALENETRWVRLCQGLHENPSVRWDAVPATLAEVSGRAKGRSLLPVSSIEPACWSPQSTTSRPSSRRPPNTFPTPSTAKLFPRSAKVSPRPAKANANHHSESRSFIVANSVEPLPSAGEEVSDKDCDEIQHRKRQFNRGWIYHRPATLVNPCRYLVVTKPGLA